MTIDKLAWVLIVDRKVLYVRSKGKELFYNPGGKREEGESDAQALIREIKEELNVYINLESIQYWNTFRAQAHGKSQGTFVEIKCYQGTYNGQLTPSTEIEELAWFTIADRDRTSITGQLILDALKNANLIN